MPAEGCLQWDGRQRYMLMSYELTGSATQAHTHTAQSEPTGTSLHAPIHPKGAIDFDVTMNDPHSERF